MGAKYSMERTQNVLEAGPEIEEAACWDTSITVTGQKTRRKSKG